MSQTIKTAGGNNAGINYDTKIPSLSDAANIVEAFKLYHFGLDNYDGSVSPAADSIEGHLDAFDSRIDSLEAAPISLTGTINSASTTLGLRINSASVALTGQINSASTILGLRINSASVTLAGQLNSASVTLAGQLNSASVTLAARISDIEGLALLGL